MPALCLMLSGTYYAQNYAGIIGASLAKGKSSYKNLNYKIFICQPEHKDRLKPPFLRIKVISVHLNLSRSKVLRVLEHLIFYCHFIGVWFFSIPSCVLTIILAPSTLESWGSHCNNCPAVREFTSSALQLYSRLLNTVYLQQQSRLFVCS